MSELVSENLKEAQKRQCFVPYFASERERLEEMSELVSENLKEAQKRQCFVPYFTSEREVRRDV